MSDSLDQRTASRWHAGEHSVPILRSPPRAELDRFTVHPLQCNVIHSPHGARTEEQAAHLPHLHLMVGTTRLLVVVGGSGVGKSTLIDEAMRAVPEAFSFLVDTTTRQRRSTETTGCSDKRFVPPQQFAEMVYDHMFVAWSRNAVNGEYYGTELLVLWDALVGGSILVTTVDGLSAERTLQVLRGGFCRVLLNPVVVWVRPPSVDALEARLRGAARGAAADAELASRLEANRLGHEACVALDARGAFDHVLTNDELPSATRQFTQLCSALSRRRRWHPWLSLLGPFRGVARAGAGQALNLAKWAAAGAEHCDRPRLRRHATEEGGTALLPHATPRLRGLARTLEVVPVAGGKPKVPAWVILSCLPHAAWCALHLHWPLSCPPTHAELCAALRPRWRESSPLLVPPLLLLAVATGVAGALHDKALSRTPRFRRFKTSLSHFALRWFGPVPLLLALTWRTNAHGGGGRWLIGALLALQGLVLALHWLVKGLFKRAWPSVDPSGHGRVCLNTIVYAAWLGSAATAMRLSPLQSALAVAWVGLQLATVFVSRLTHHTLLDMLLGYACAAPQLALLHAVFS